jgi:hypothetical protein
MPSVDPRERKDSPFDVFLLNRVYLHWQKMSLHFPYQLLQCIQAFRVMIIHSGQIF